MSDEQALLTLTSLAKLEPDPAARSQQLEEVLRREIALWGEAHHRVADTLDDLGDAVRDAGDRDGAVSARARGPTSWRGPNLRSPERCKSAIRSAMALAEAALPHANHTLRPAIESFLHRR